MFRNNIRVGEFDTTSVQSNPVEWFGRNSRCVLRAIKKPAKHVVENLVDSN